MKKKGWAISSANYEDLRIALQNNKEVLFDDNNKPQKIKRIMKDLRYKL